MDYKQLSSEPIEISANTILIRLIDGLGFRYYWATEGLRDIDVQFKPCESSMNMIELLNHIHQLAYISIQTLQNKPFIKQESIAEFETLRQSTLDYISNCRNTLENIFTDELSIAKFTSANNKFKLPFWNIINGPLADALTYVGQITSWRRINDNPVLKHNPLLGSAN
jgi:hypothetical protein